MVSDVLCADALYCSFCQNNGVAENWMMELNVKLAAVTEKSTINGIVRDWGEIFYFFSRFTGGTGREQVFVFF